MKIPPIYFAYFGSAVLVGLIFSFGMIALVHQPLQVQVSLNQYQPAVAPAPAIPTVAPVVTKTGKFDPAPAPVVVTTAPLPMITPEPEGAVGMCDPTDADSISATTCVMTETIVMMMNLYPLLFALAMIAVAFNVIGQLFSRR